MTVTRDGGSDQRKAGAVRKPKPKDHGGIGLNNDGALDVVAPGDLARRIAERDAEEADEPAAGRSHLMSKIINAQYAVGRTLPREKPPRGHVLAHNDIEHTVRTLNGVAGFRWWTWPKDELPPDFGRCKCGWSGLPHYARRPSAG